MDRRDVAASEYFRANARDMLPLVLALLWKLWGKAGVIYSVGIGLLVLLGISVYVTAHSPSAACFLLHTRAWEMLAGGVVYFMAQSVRFGGREKGHKGRPGFAIARLLLISLSVLFFDSSDPWPGHLALLPVIGAMLVLYASCQNNRTLSHPVAQWLG
ncbi:hypothetical protein [Microbulbifer agarilyticus]|uniref:hypothetical protein n=1 Tax=Microbulbifer agarilyticus TaxID=260552 RepID=UPI001CD5EF0F|nr:hypothetical protein [Microbulbifer agarilyticus]MCA0901519.1 hypothetical protein [Microbulbifer agarilyticus]